MKDIIWSYYQNQRADSFSGAYKRLNYIVKKLIKLNKKKILNVGVGDAYFEKTVEEKGLKAYSLDPDPESIKKVISCLKIEAKVGNLEDIPFPDNFFEAVVVSEVLEHIPKENMTKVFSEIKRVLSAGGIVIGTVPRNENLKEQEVICPYCGKIFHRWGHKQDFTVGKLRIELEKYFEIMENKEKLFIPWRELNWKGKILNFFKFMISLTGARVSGMNIFFIGFKR